MTQTYTAQQAFAELERQIKEGEIIMEEMGEKEQADHALRYLKLKSAAEREIRLNQDEEQEIQREMEVKSQTYYVEHLKAMGFTCDNSLLDWERVYNHPEIYGHSWKQQALESSQTKTIEDFLQFCKQNNL